MHVLRNFLSIVLKNNKCLLSTSGKLIIPIIAFGIATYALVGKCFSKQLWN